MLLRSLGAASLSQTQSSPGARPMAPGRVRANRRAQREVQEQPQIQPRLAESQPPAHHPQNVIQQETVQQPAPEDELFIDPLMGTPLGLYVEKDVENRDHIIDLIVKHGGIVSPAYSGVPYILVNPRRESGQNLYRQYANKKGKVVLDARWVYECISANALHTYHTNWAGCKVTGQEQIILDPPRISQSQTRSTQPQAGPSTALAPPTVSVQPDLQVQAQAQTQPHSLINVQATQAAHQSSIPPPITASTADPLAATASYSYSLYPHAGPPQTWQTASSIAPQQTHMAPPTHGTHYQPHEYPPQQHWAPSPGYAQPQGYEYQHSDWVQGAAEYYTQQYGTPYPTTAAPPATEAYVANPSPTEEHRHATGLAEAMVDRTRGRKRTRGIQNPAPPASTLVRRNTAGAPRSPTPPSRVIKSTYGGNLFTSDDVEYLKKYIEYCQQQGLVLSLREICERIAIKAPHHTFYSWRRYCNKHQIRLGGYSMDVDQGPPDPPNAEPIREESDQIEVQAGLAQGQPEDGGKLPATGVTLAVVNAARQAAHNDMASGRARSPTPPKALYRSTTGKGVAFTDEDVTFLIRYLSHRDRVTQGKIDMVAFWKDVATKAPHHSRASWMKFYRRHKHELHYEEGDEPLPQPPEKKMRYSKADDILLAQYFAQKPDGTSDSIFQEFARLHPHHPWKGWQEHHRIHKAKIDYLISKIEKGETISPDD